MDSHLRDAGTGRWGSVNQVVGGLFGLVYLVVGIAGFFVSGDHEFADTEGGRLLGLFEINGLHNVVHLAIGLVMLLASARLTSARAVNILVAVTLAAVGIAGFFAAGEEWNILAINDADNGLHLASAALLLLVGLFADRGVTVYDTRGETRGAGTTAGTGRHTTRGH